MSPGKPPYARRTPPRPEIRPAPGSPLGPLRERILALPGTEETMPFGPEVLVYKVGGRMFALVAWMRDPLSLSLKCDPQRAVSLRQAHPAITGAWHLNKTHWNGIVLDGSVPDDLIQDLIVHSRQLVIARLPRRTRDALTRGGRDTLAD